MSPCGGPVVAFREGSRHARGTAAGNQTVRQFTGMFCSSSASAYGNTPTETAFSWSACGWTTILPHQPAPPLERLLLRLHTPTQVQALREPKSPLPRRQSRRHQQPHQRNSLMRPSSGRRWCAPEDQRRAQKEVQGGRRIGDCCATESILCDACIHHAVGVGSWGLLSEAPRWQAFIWLGDRLVSNIEEEAGMVSLRQITLSLQCMQLSFRTI